MREEERVIKPKLGNVSQACKMFGYSRDSYYRFKELYENSGEMGISEQTIYNRKKLEENGSLTLDVEQTSPVFLSSAEKLALLLEGSKKDEPDMGAWLREKGLHGERLNLWEQELRDTLKEKDTIFVKTSLISSGYFSMNRQIVLWSIVLFAERYITF